MPIRKSRRRVEPSVEPTPPATMVVVEKVVPVVVKVSSPMTDHDAMVSAYAIAAEALRQAMEGDMVHGISEDGEDIMKVYTSCEAIRQCLIRASTRKNGPA